MYSVFERADIPYSQWEKIRKIRRRDVASPSHCAAKSSFLGRKYGAFAKNYSQMRIIFLICEKYFGNTANFGSICEVYFANGPKIRRVFEIFFFQIF